MRHTIAVVPVSLALIVIGCRSAADEPAAVDAFAVVAAADAMAATELWPGFDPRATPVAIYDGRRTLLFRHPSPPAGFLPVDGRPDVRTYPGRHPGVTANSSAEINGVATATLMPAADSVTTRSRAGILIHEAFHVFQRLHHPGWSANEADAFTYPVDDPSSLTLRRLESESLRRALAASDDDSAACWSRAALAIRAQRAGLIPRAAHAYDSGIEMNEGLASYVEGHAVERPDAAILPAADFGPAEFRQRGYATGAALARLLDRFSPQWKASLERSDSTSLDVALSDALGRSDVAAAVACAFTDAEHDRAGAAAAADVATLRTALARERSDFMEQPGWRLVIVATGNSLFPQGFDPLNLRRVGQGEVLHTRWLEVGNDAGVVKVLGHAALTRAAGAHPLFDGVAELTIAGLTAEPPVMETDSMVAVKADGVEAELRGATVERAGQTVTIRLPSVR